jgi:uncharacterized membrane protein HdeD (DUF308 family)/predicted flap endonuclease-1-like 5' DNA nuclease
MTTTTRTGGAETLSTPWWLVLIEALAAILIGTLLLISPARSMVVLVRLLGFYFLFSGIISLISIFVDRSGWGWKLITGLLGILAGIAIVDYPLWSAVIVPEVFLVVIAVFAIIIGVIYLIQAFQGAGWGRGILGVVSILLGVIIFARPILAALSLPLVIGILALSGGILALIDAFRLRSLQNLPTESTPVSVTPDQPAKVDDLPEPAPSPAITQTDPDSDLEFLGLASREDLEKFNQSLEYIEGIGPAYAGKLSKNGINTPLDLLKQGSTPAGRSDIAKRSEVSGLLILEWINHIDLYRIKGVGSEYADLLEESGVDTVMELAHRNPVNLFEKMSSVNEVKQLVRKLPAQSQVEDWIEQAKTLPRVIQY